MIMLNKISYLANDYLGAASRVNSLTCLVVVVKMPLGMRIFRNASGPGREIGITDVIVLAVQSTWRSFSFAYLC